MVKSHLALVASMQCVVCGRLPVNAHHAVGGSIFVRIGPRGRHKHSDFLTLPLCPVHHQGVAGIHTIGVQTWEAQFGFQSVMLDRLGALLGLDLWKLASEETEQKRAARKAKPSTKILKRRFT